MIHQVRVAREGVQRVAVPRALRQERSSARSSSGRDRLAGWGCARSLARAVASEGAPMAVHNGGSYRDGWSTSARGGRAALNSYAKAPALRWLGARYCSLTQYRAPYAIGGAGAESVLCAARHITQLAPKRERWPSAEPVGVLLRFRRLRPRGPSSLTKRSPAAPFKAGRSARKARMGLCLF